MAGTPRDPVSVMVYAVLAGIGDEPFSVREVFGRVQRRVTLAVLPMTRMMELAVTAATRRILVRAQEHGHRAWLCIDAYTDPPTWKRYGACTADELRTALALRDNQLDQDRRARSQMLGFLRKLETAERRGEILVVDDLFTSV